MTRFDILKAYTIQDGIIKTPGIFEGAKIYVPYFWGIYLSGEAHEVSGGIVQFLVSHMDRSNFPELGNRTMIRLTLNGDKILEA